MSEQDRKSESAQPTAAATETSSTPSVYNLALQRKIQRRALQRKLDSEMASPAATHAAAEHGTSGTGGPLPHLDTIQQSFGKHDVSGVSAHTDAKAAEGAQAMGAQAYATGNSVAFAGSPSLHTAAHEAAHVVQQRSGVHLKGGVGEEGDSHERHADAVADAVVAGKSAESLLDAKSSGGGVGVQHKLSPEHIHSLPPNSAKLKTALSSYEARYDAANPTGNLTLLEAIKVACDGIGKSYAAYIDELKVDVEKELRTERANAQKATPKAPPKTPPPSGQTPPPTVTATPPAKETAPVTGVTAVATAEHTPVVPVGPKPATGDVPAFEQGMGLLALKDARSMSYVDALMAKIMNTLDARARLADQTAVDVETKKATVDALLKQIGTENNTIAGAVGTNADHLRQTMAPATGGTLREKMTVFFNFAGKFQEFILTSAESVREAFLSKATVNVTAIRARIEKIKSEGGAQNEDGSFKPNEKSKRLPALPDTHKAEKLQGDARAPREATEAPAKANPKVGDLGAHKETALGQGELDTMFPDRKGEDGHVDREAVKNEAVTWRLGVNAWKEKQDSQFCNDLRALNLPFGAGPSGTTARIFSTAELLAEPKNDILRMACIGYLIPIHAHSLLEVVAGAKTHGVEAPDFTTLGAEVYEHITPFDPVAVKDLKKTYGMEPEPHK